MVTLERAVATQIAHGQIVAQYRKRKHWTQEQLAAALRLDKRTVQRIESQEVISSDERRRLLIGVLGIPAELLNVEEQRHQIEEVHLTFNPDHMVFFEAEFVTRWEMFHYGGTTRAARGLDIWTQEIARFAAEARDTAWRDRAFSLLAMSYQLQNNAYRDLQIYERAHQAYRQAVKVAKALDNPELIASAMAREGVTLIQEDRPEEAISCLQSALEPIRNVGLFHLKGYILQALSEAYAKTQQAQLCWQTIGLAERALERADATEEMSRAMVNLATITAQKGVDAVLLKDSDRAITLIERSLKTYDPSSVRSRSRLLAQKAEAYGDLGLIDACIATAEDALTLARSVGSQKTVSRVKQLHSKLANSRARTQPGVARLGALLTIT